jgi:hypothetical protein
MRPEVADLREFLRWLCVADALHDGRGSTLVVLIDNPERLLASMDDALAGLDGHFRWHHFLALGGGTVISLSGRAEVMGRLVLVSLSIVPRSAYSFMPADSGAAVLDVHAN